MELRELIADILRAHKDERISLTDAISATLAIPEIREALKINELVKRGAIVNAGTKV